MGTFNQSAYEQLKGQRGVGAGSTSQYFYEMPRGKRVLEIGFGQGELVQSLLEKNNAVYGVDIGLESMTGAIKDGFIDKAHLLWLDVSTERLPWLNDFFDTAYCTECIEHLENPGHMFLEAKRVLKPDGKFIVSFPRPEDNLGYGGGEHAHFYPGFLIRKSFRMFCQQMYFKILKYFEFGSTAWYLLENIKDNDQEGIHLVLQGNYDEEVLYGKLKEKAWDDKKEIRYPPKTMWKLL